MNDNMPALNLVEEIKALIDSSPFKRSSYNVDIRLKGFIDGLMLYIKDKDYSDISEVFEAVPAFQRDNDKWTPAMQTKFIENILMGYRTTIMLYELVPASRYAVYDKCFILDGLQRITAIYEFMKGRLTPFGMTYDQLCESKILLGIGETVGVRIYAFTTEIEAIEFYISMNENITHSAADILKAKNVLNKLKGEQLCRLNG